MQRFDFIFLLLAGFFLASLVLANSFVFKFIDVPLPIIGVATAALLIDLLYPIFDPRVRLR